MNFKRRTSHDDVLFVIALLVPAIFSTDRLFESKHEMDLIARAKAPTVQVANATDPAKDMFAMVMAG
jgi:hypothetical protein